MTVQDQAAVAGVLVTVEDGLWGVNLQSRDTRVLGSQAVAVLVHVGVAYLGAAVVDGCRRAGWFVCGQDGLAVWG